MKNQAGILLLMAALIAVAATLLSRGPEAVATAGPTIPATVEPSHPPQASIETPSPSERSQLQQVPDPVPTPVAGLADEDAEFKRRTFKELLDQFDGVPLERTDWPGFTPQQLCPMLMVMSVAAVMDAGGTSRPEIADGMRRDVHDGGRWDHAFDYNGREYRFNRGMFPVYDEFNELQRAEARRQEAYRREQAASTKPNLFPLDDLPYPEDFMLRASQFAHGALALR
jgi:hypothetical protein